MARSYSLSQQRDSQPLDAVTTAQVTVTNTSTAVLAVNAARRFCWITNTGSVDVWLKFGATAVANTGHYLKAEGGTVLFDTSCPTQVINGITASGSSVVSVSSA